MSLVKFDANSSRNLSKNEGQTNDKGRYIAKLQSIVVDAASKMPQLQEKI